MFTSDAAAINLVLSNSTSDRRASAPITVAPLRDDKRWAFSLTFDDGYVETYTNGRSYMERYGYKGGIPMVGRFLDRNQMGSYTYINDAQMRELYLSGWGIFNHTYSHQYVSYFPQQRWQRCNDISRRPHAYRPGSGAGRAGLPDHRLDCALCGHGLAAHRARQR